MENELKSAIRKTLEPVFESLVDLTFNTFKSVEDNLPADMPHDAKKKIIEDVIKAHGEQLKAAVEQAMPKDFDAKLKEAVNGGK